MGSPDDLHDIARAVQLALAPAFLLTAIAGLLNVMASRLSRIIDRGRYLTEGPNPPASLELDHVRQEQRALEMRRHLASVAITACTVSALVVCIVIAALFLEVLLNVPLKWLAGGLFTVAMLALVVGLTYFLREVHLAMQSIRIRLPEPR
jgi:uncharacterized membrane protein YvlD (DUF360 family)